MTEILTKTAFTWLEIKDRVRHTDMVQYDLDNDRVNLYDEKA